MECEIIKFVWYQSPEIWATIIAGLSAIVTLIGGGLFFWKRNKILSNFQKDLKKYQQEIDKEIEKYKSELDAKNKDIQSQLDTKLALLHIKEQQLGSVRMSAISETYEAMGRLTTEAQRLFSLFKPAGQEPDEEIYNELCEHGNTFIAIWNKNKLYFPKDISDAIYKMNKELHINTQMYFVYKTSKSDKQYEYAKTARSSLSKAIEHIEKRFREVIGVETKSEL